MYGRTLTTHIPEYQWHDTNIFVIASDVFGVVDDKAFETVQEAYSCCSDNLPLNGERGELWVCNICDRIWGIPYDITIGRSWVLTKLELVQEEQQNLLALYSYRWWVKTLVFLALSFIVMFASFIGLLALRSQHAVIISFFIFIGMLGITAVVAVKWRRLLNQYRLTVSET